LVHADAPDGFVCHSHAGDDALAAKRYVRERLGLAAGAARLSPHLAAARPPRATSDDADRIAGALQIWGAAQHPRRTPAEAYLLRRGLKLPEEAAGSALRWHPDCPFGKERVGCMVALVRDIRTNEPKAIHRTAIDRQGNKLSHLGSNGRLTLGPIGGGAIKLTPDENVTLSLAVGEGVESTLSIREIDGLANLAAWSLIAANQVEQFPVLAGIETLWIAVDNDPTGRRSADVLACRWNDAGPEVMRVRPVRDGADLNDVIEVPVAAA
jgi:hypothetical protein